MSIPRRTTGWRGAFILGLVAGLVQFGGTIYWTAEVMRQHGGLHVGVAALIAFLLIAYMAMFPAIFAAIVGRAVEKGGPHALWWAPPVWVATEWARGALSGFPWIPLGSSQASVLPVVQLASVTGVFGLSALLTLVSTAAAVLAVSRDRRARLAVGATGLVLVTVVALGAWRISGNGVGDGAPIRVGLVQGNVAQDQKYDPRYRDVIIGRYVELSRSVIDAGAQLVLWPEASTPFYFDVDSVLALPIRRLAAERSVPIIVGSDEYEPARDGAPARYFNSAILVGASGRTVASYKKMHLVPFGEYVPFSSLLFFAKPLVEAVSDFSAGDTPVVFDAGACRVSVSICYESIYPGLSRQFVAGGSQLLATITNDAWFGRSSAPYQHFEQGAIRAVEQGRYVVRAANTGISGAIDPYGRTVATTPLFEAAALTVDVRLLSGRTIYSRIGDVVVWLSICATIALLWKTTF